MLNLRLSLSGNPKIKSCLTTTSGGVPHSWHYPAIIERIVDVLTSFVVYTASKASRILVQYAGFKLMTLKRK